MSLALIGWLSLVGAGVLGLSRDGQSPKGGSAVSSVQHPDAQA